MEANLQIIGLIFDAAGIVVLVAPALVGMVGQIAARSGTYWGYKRRGKLRGVAYARGLAAAAVHRRRTRRAGPHAGPGRAADGTPLHSLRPLLENLVNATRTVCRATSLEGAQQPEFVLDAQLSAERARALELLQGIRVERTRAPLVDANSVPAHLLANQVVVPETPSKLSLVFVPVGQSRRAFQERSAHLRLTLETQGGSPVASHPVSCLEEARHSTTGLAALVEDRRPIAQGTTTASQAWEYA